MLGVGAHRLLLGIHSWLLVGVLATRGSSLAGVLISIGLMPANTESTRVCSAVLLPLTKVCFRSGIKGHNRL